MTEQSPQAKEMARIVREIEDVENARKATSKHYREQLKDLHDQLGVLAGEVETGQLKIGDDQE